jgi:PAS domain S-box-containing protein
VKQRKRLYSIALKIAAVYSLFGFLWIILSDRLLNFLVRDAEIVQSIQTVKGWLYVLVTAAIIYMLVDRYDRSVQKSQNAYRRLLENIADPIFLIGSNGQIIDINEAAVETLGYSRKQLLDCTISDVSPSANEKEWEKAINEAGPDQRFLFESKYRRKDGTSYPVEVVACVFEENEQKFCISVARDISQRLKTMELLLQREKMDSLGGMAAGIAHEINNPLAAILGSCQNIRNRIFNDSPKNLHIAQECNVDVKAMREYMRKRDILSMISTISKAGERASQIISSMLNFGFSNSQKLYSCNVSTLLDESIELLSSDVNFCSTYMFNKLRITKKYIAEDNPVCCVRSEIRQVLVNMIQNACEAMAEKNYPSDEQPELILRTKYEKEGTIIEVEDNGPGISQNRLKKVFEPFYTSKKVGEGTGLGLSISYFIITEQHKGTMEVSSILGEGTKFTITLPNNSGKCS